ncbi:MAG: hypothetical protein OD815_000750 [Candidatus Alkanophagales archaeon MCA70_species_2]|nr:hypothetical protein [Candidatus Alkanophaga liquidiphilum]
MRLEAKPLDAGVSRPESGFEVRPPRLEFKLVVRELDKSVALQAAPQVALQVASQVVPQVAPAVPELKPSLEPKRLDASLPDVRITTTPSAVVNPVSLPRVMLEARRLDAATPPAAPKRTEPSVNPVLLPKRRLEPKLLDKSLKEEKEERVGVEERVTQDQAEEVSAGFEEVPDFLDFMGEGASRIFEGKPLCIILPKREERWEHVVATVCREAYREKRGGLPEPLLILKNLEELKFEFEPRVEGEIVVVEEVKLGDEEQQLLRRTLSGFFSRGLGYLILVSEDPDGLAAWIKQEVPSVRPHLLRLNPEMSEEQKRKVLSFVSGKLRATPEAKQTAEAGIVVEEQVSFGEAFKEAVDAFDRELEKFLGFSEAPKKLRKLRDKLVASAPDKGEPASGEHSAMKAFVWLYAWKKHQKRVIPELEDERGVDVRVLDENYEVETFYGVGYPMAKLVKKIQEKFRRGEKVYFVLRNVSILLHLRDLLTFRKDWRDEGYNVEIFGLDLEAKELIPLDWVVSCLRS